MVSGFKSMLSLRIPNEEKQTTIKPKKSATITCSAFFYNLKVAINLNP